MVMYTNYDKKLIFDGQIFFVLIIIFKYGMLII